MRQLLSGNRRVGAKYLGLLVKSPKSEERAKAKNYYKQQVYRLLRKAKANIEAVEKGTFGKGHLEEKEVL